MKSFISTKHLAVLAATTLVVASCGGSGGDSTYTPPPPANNAPTVAAIGNQVADQDTAIAIDFSVDDGNPAQPP